MGIRKIKHLKKMIKKNNFCYKNINCSFKKFKKVLTYIKKFNLKKILFFLNLNPTKTFLLLEKYLINSLKSSININKIKFSEIILDQIFVTKGKVFKKNFPRAKGRCDFIKKSTLHLFIVLKWEIK
ncbi:uL22 family ribosomal protein [Candidatus Vidania fulgoroideorum]